MICNEKHFTFDMRNTDNQPGAELGECKSTGQTLYRKQKSLSLRYNKRLNLVKMDCLEYIPQIEDTFEKVRALSFEEKKESVFDEPKMNRLLDRILEFKKTFTDKTNKINNLVEKIEEITWFNILDDDTLMLINDLISSIRDLHSSLLRQYISLNYIRAKGIAKEETKKFKATIDDLKDVAADLESRFFFLPNIADFQETTKELSLL